MARRRGVARAGHANGVYHAEWFLFERAAVRDHPAVSLAEARALVEKYAPGCVVRRKRGTSPEDRSGRAWGPGGTFPNGCVTLGGGAPLWVVLHEIAHVLTPEDPGHGREFRQVYLRLLEDEWSAWWARRMRAALRRIGYRDVG